MIEVESDPEPIGSLKRPIEIDTDDSCHGIRKMIKQEENENM